MHVPGHNPFLSTGPLNLEDLILYGTYSDLLRRDQQSLGGEYGTTFGATLNFQTNIGDLGEELALYMYPLSIGGSSKGGIAFDNKEINENN